MWTFQRYRNWLDQKKRWCMHWAEKDSENSVEATKLMLPVDIDHVSDSEPKRPAGSKREKVGKSPEPERKDSEEISAVIEIPEGEKLETVISDLLKK